jgi:hypothetical protein
LIAISVRWKMKALSLAEVVQQIYQADERRDPKSIFAHVPEHDLWQYAQAILGDPEQGYLVGPTLLYGICEAFDGIQDLVAVRETILSALSLSSDSLVYNAAQKTILSHALGWDSDASKQFYTSFKDNYLAAAQEGDHFVATLALEGAVMLPIYRSDERLLYNAIGLLLNDFPFIPDNPGDSALLPVKALKLLGYCYDLRPNDFPLAQKIQECIGVNNIAVDVEARFNLGLIRLYDAFRAPDAATLQAALREARDRFEEAVAIEEGRTDAELFLTISQCYLLLLTKSPPSQVSDTAREAQEVLTERLLAFGGAVSLERTAVEFYLVQIIMYLERWIKQLATAKQWPNIVPPMRVLADTYAAIRQFEATKGLIGVASTATQDWVMLPQVQSRFVQVQEITAKIEGILADEVWRKTSPESEVAFYDLVLREVQGSSFPKDETVAELEGIRAAAEQDAPILAHLIDELLAKGIEPRDVLRQAAWQRLEEERKANQFMLASGPARDIYDKIAPTLLNKLDWKPISLKWKFLKQAIRYTAHYFDLTYVATLAEEGMSFLFAEEIKGLGKKASEADLRDHFYNTMKWSCPDARVQRESGEAVPGRPDLIFRFPDDINFPIEVKCENSDVSREHIHTSYVAQAQSYAAGTRGVGFLFVLDTICKKSGVPLKNQVDYWYIDHRQVPDAERLDYVIVVIFPANRYRPSDHSKRHRRKRKPTPA